MLTARALRVARWPTKTFGPPPILNVALGLALPPRPLLSHEALPFTVVLSTVASSEMVSASRVASSPMITFGVLLMAPVAVAVPNGIVEPARPEAVKFIVLVTFAVMASALPALISPPGPTYERVLSSVLAVASELPVAKKNPFPVLFETALLLVVEPLLMVTLLPAVICPLVFRSGFSKDPSV